MTSSTPKVTSSTASILLVIITIGVVSTILSHSKIINNYGVGGISVVDTTARQLQHDAHNNNNITRQKLTSADFTKWRERIINDHTTTSSIKTTSTTSTDNDGMHICTCLTNDHPQNTNLPPKPKRIRWLHIPKTGTSFISTLWSYAASTHDRYIDLNVNSYECSYDILDHTSYSMYDYALMRRYPWEMYGAQVMIPPSSEAAESSESGKESYSTATDSNSNSTTIKTTSSRRRKLDKDIPLGLVGGTQHISLALNLEEGEQSSSTITQQQSLSQHYQNQKVKDKLRKWGSEIFQHNITVTSFFRQPEDRIVSAYYDGRHSSGFTPDMYKDIIKASYQTPSSRRHTCNINNMTYYNPLECFARYPGIAGCMSRMLTGESCADGILQEDGVDNLPLAIDIILNHLDFVGVMEDWNESICQFHRLFGGKQQLSSSSSVEDDRNGIRYWNSPLQGEFSNVHKSDKSKILGIKHLHGFEDIADRVVYEAVKYKFKQMIGEQRCYKYMTWDDLKAERDNNNEAILQQYNIKFDNEGKVCKPKHCAELKKQCGEWDDGCGKTIICGMCNVGRTGLPSTWRVHCVEGQCIYYCSPWDAQDLWFLSDDRGDSSSLAIMKDLTKAINIHENQEYLSPVDAVLICEMACTSKV